MTDIAPAIPTPAELTEAPAGNLPAPSGASVDRYGATVDGGQDRPDPRHLEWTKGFDPAGNEQHRNAVHHHLVREWGAERANELWERWGGGKNYGQNVAFHAAFLGKHRELDDVAARWGLSDHPCLIEMGAIMGRYYARVPGDPRSIAKPPNSGPQHMTPDAIDEQIRATRKAIADATAEQDYTRANKLYADEQALIARRDGARSIVNGRRTV